jgi:membrane associated rhomboid family serine protease
MVARPNYRNYRVSFNFFVTPGVQALLIANGAVFIFQALLNHFSGSLVHHQMLMWFGLVPSGVIPGLRIWQPFTYLFFHDVNTIWHIVFNMLFLWMFGRDLELAWGRNRFLRYYFLTGVGAGLIEVLVKAVPVLWGHKPNDIPTIGASGAIFGILIANAILFPDRQVMVFPIPVSIRMRTVVAVMAAIEFFGTLGSGGDGVSHLCHVGGMLVGWIYLRRGSFLYRMRNGLADWKSRRNRKRFEVYMHDHKKEPPSRPDHWLN